MSVYHVPGTAPGAKNIVVNKIVPAFMELIVHKWVGKGVDTQIINDNYIE